MREFMKIVESQLATGHIVPGRELLDRYHGKSYRYRDLPEMAKKSLTQYMVIEGENDEYKKQRYGYLEVPVDDLMRIIYDQQCDDGRTYEEFWQAGWYDPTNPPSREVYNEIWPIIWGSIGWEDGSHRLEVYRGNGLKMIPVVVCL
jgi:hypothetical protein